MKIGVRILVVLVLASVAVTGCRKKKRHFEPMVMKAAEDPDAAPRTSGGGGEGSDGDGGAAGPGPGDGDGDGEPAGEFSAAEANDIVTFLDQDLPAGLKAEELFTKLARKCSTLAPCAAPDCRAVLASCSGSDKTGCGSRLLATCGPFNDVAAGTSGDELGDRTETWIRDLWGDLLFKVRTSLPESKHERVDELAQRHQL